MKITPLSPLSLKIDVKNQGSRVVIAPAGPEGEESSYMSLGVIISTQSGKEVPLSFPDLIDERVCPDIADMDENSIRAWIGRYLEVTYQAGSIPNGSILFEANIVLDGRSKYKSADTVDIGEFEAEDISGTDAMTMAKMC